MRHRCLRQSPFLLALLAPALLAAAALAGPVSEPRPPLAPDYARDVRPILAARCFSCHGADEKKRQAGLRLDAPNRSVVAGDILASELARRIGLADSDSARMPPSDTGHRLSDSERAILLRWIDSGAKYAPHWSFAPIPPARADSSTIDRLVDRRLAQSGLSRSPSADRYTLIRRVSLDLTGLPPSPAQVDAFVRDSRPDAYERLVDSLLASPHFGEKWARMWMDVARYADSAGYGSDPLRPNLWPWRDWVIRAFNENLPFDQFTVEQLAGDLLPGATPEQRVATGFHRNTMTNTEGGTDDEEFRLAAVKDRSNVTLQAWMGLTAGCAQCHSHKFDPISQTEYYRLTAYFDQTEDNDQPDERPTLAYFTTEQKTRRAALQNEIDALAAEAARAPKAASPRARFVRVTLPGRGVFLMLAEVTVRSGGKNVARSAKASQSSTDFGGDAARAIDGNPSGNFYDATVTHTAQSDDPWWEVDLGAEFPIDDVALWPRTDAHAGMLHDAVVSLRDSAGKPVATTVASGVVAAGARVAFADSPAARMLAAKRAELAAIVPTPVPVMQELPSGKRRTSHLLTLGNFLLPQAAVTPGLPASFPPLPEGAPRTRLGLARWLVSSDNPLTARVQVNRFWAQLFGVGMVETEEDFGTQGALPSHPELLDSLASEFRRDWNVKRLLKTIVMSQTYRQSSRATPDRLARDPADRLLSRYPRRRLDAEGVRDQALAISGLLSEKLGGPSVYPPQPDNLWQAAFNGQRSYPTSVGPDRFRRGLYTFWRRTTPYPSMQTFDAPSREVCTLRRKPTNTPLQALVTLNDPAYVEMAQALARRLVRDGGRAPGERAGYGLRLALGRPPTPAQIATLTRLYADERAHYAAHPDDARKLAASAALPLPDGADPAELAAWTVVANVLLNLDGVLTKG